MADEIKIPEVVEVLTAVGVAAATAGATLTALPAAGLAAVPALVGGTAKLAIQAYGRHQQRKAERWFQLVADLWEVGSPEEASKVIEESIDEEWAHKSVVEGTRAILNDIDDVALPALAKVVARRLKSKTPPDRRDRRAVALLCELEPDSFAGVATVVQLARVTPGAPVLSMTVHKPEGESKDALVFDKAPLDRTVPSIARATPPDDWRRAFFLLKKHEFGLDAPSGRIGSRSGPHVVEMAREDIQYLAEVLR